VPNFKVKFLYNEQTYRKKIVIHSYNKYFKHHTQRHFDLEATSIGINHLKPSKAESRQIEEHASEVANFASDTNSRVDFILKLLHIFHFNLQIASLN